MKAWLPVYIKFHGLTVACSLDSPRRFEMFSFNKFTQNLNVKAFLKDSSILPCICKALILQTKIIKILTGHKLRSYSPKVLNTKKTITLNRKKLNLAWWRMSMIVLTKSEINMALTNLSSQYGSIKFQGELMKK